MIIEGEEFMEKKYKIGLLLEPNGEKEGDIYRCEIDAGGCQEYFRTKTKNPKCINCDQVESVYKVIED